MRIGGGWSQSVRSLLGWSGVAIGCWGLCLLALQALFGRQIEGLQSVQLGRELALNVRLTELALERYPPHLVSELTGLDLAVRFRPPMEGSASPFLKRQAKVLQHQLCQRLAHCPMVEASGRSRVVWIELISPLEPVWLRVPLRSPMAWPPEPTLLGSSLVAAAVITGALFLLLEVEQPLRRLEKVLSRVGEGEDPEAVPARGAPEVKRLTHRFNAMVQRLAATRQERATMLAGIAHDLRAPITRLQFRLSLPSLSVAERDRCANDLEALERITEQFLLFAGGGDGEEAIELPLDQLLAEVSSSHSSDQLHLDLEPMQILVRPVAISRAVANLIDNAFSHGSPPVLLRLRRRPDGCSIEVWDQGDGMPADQWDRALQPFQRLDESRGRQGHCGLGLAIVAHVAQLHGGTLSRLPADMNGEDCDSVGGRFGLQLLLPFPLKG